MKNLLTALILVFLISCTAFKKTTKNVWRAEKVTFDAPGFRQKVDTVKYEPRIKKPKAR